MELHEDQDAISIRHLQLPHGVIAPDIWSKFKDQPVLLNIKLELKNTFTSAASLDELDESTIHYGILAKKIRAASQQDQTLSQLLTAVHDVITSMGRKESGRFILARSEIEVEMPKASMHGEGATLLRTMTCDKLGKQQEETNLFSIKDVKIMTLVGVNAIERSARQPVVANMTLSTSSLQTEGMNSFFELEGKVVQIIQHTAFETLESLADHTVKELQTQLLGSSFPGSQIRLHLAKPRAIAFADAPAVEVSRRTLGPPITSALQQTSEVPVMQVIRPYA
ncbi:hypothetical protein LTR78_003542 [Recurvomyces mirabilis]|uniref:Dihydroneopterin aldolase/epimerase domain-containing protein n=1 Tax=Recurvomyces mirabilis TaxID=574656 RepID=A0AAE0WRM2_9PEZI|nr:hypothetical protein LTR78_003542 [Recurvomyces mirabilis]KAK5154427.1 hypothetical protein LTS14_006562 [Recurvomyces mirabilis]